MTALGLSPFLPRGCKMGLLREELDGMELSCLQGESWGGAAGAPRGVLFNPGGTCATVG